MSPPLPPPSKRMSSLPSGDGYPPRNDGRGTGRGRGRGTWRRGAGESWRARGDRARPAAHTHPTSDYAGCGGGDSRAGADGRTLLRGDCVAKAVPSALDPAAANFKPSTNPNANTDANTSTQTVKKGEKKKKKLLVLDLNGLLLDRQRKASLTRRTPDAIMQMRQKYVYLRPHAREFFSWCLGRFEVVVWSTAQIQNVLPLVDLFAGPDPAQRPARVFAEGLCTPTRHTHPENRHKKLVLKELGKLWEQLPHHGPESTLLLDDSPYKTAANPPDTAVHPLEWDVVIGDSDSAVDGALAPGGPIREVLSRFESAVDGRAVVRALNLSRCKFFDITMTQHSIRFSPLASANAATFVPQRAISSAPLGVAR